MVKKLPAMQHTPVQFLGSGRSLGGGHGYPLQYSCLKNPMDRGARWATVHGVAKSRTRLSDFTFSFPLFTGCESLGKLSDPLSVGSQRVGYD